MKRVLVVILLLAACAKKPAPPPPPAVTSYAAAKAALEAGRLDEAERMFGELSRSATDATERDNSLLAMASLRKERGDSRGAVVYARRVVENRPDDEDALAVLVELAHDAGDLATEITAREKLVALDPDALDQRLMLAGALTAAKEPERAKSAFLGYEDARVRLITALGKAPDPAVRRAAAEALAAAHDAGTARALVLSMTDKDPQVRAAAVRAVGAVGLDLDPEVRPALRKLQTIEKDSDVLAALKDALAKPEQK